MSSSSAVFRFTVLNFALLSLLLSLLPSCSVSGAPANTNEYFQTSVELQSSSPQTQNVHSRPTTSQATPSVDDELALVIDVPSSSGSSSSSASSSGGSDVLVPLLPFSENADRHSSENDADTGSESSLVLVGTRAIS